MEYFKKQYERVVAFTTEMSEDHITAYAAQAAYFFVLSFIPIILLLLTLVKFTPVTKADVMTAVITVMPDSVTDLVTSVVNQVYNQSMGIIPITAIVALWSAGKGVQSVNAGLNCIYDCRETRNFIVLRVRAAIYTVLFLVALLVFLVLSVFGNTLYEFVARYIPILGGVIAGLLQTQAFVSPMILIIFMMMSYIFLPNKKMDVIEQLPGAVFAALSWVVISLFFSVYMDVFQGFSTMYGSLTTIILIMLWMYFCMYAMLMGAEINAMYSEAIFTDPATKKKREEENCEHSESA